MQSAIRKMLRREVWGYWYGASQSDRRIDQLLDRGRVEALLDDCFLGKAKNLLTRTRPFGLR